MQIKRVTVIGGGTMGSGIVQVSAINDFNVTLLEVSPELIAKSRLIIEHDLHRLAKKFYKNDSTAQKAYVQRAIERISYSWNAREAVQNADLVIEAINEKIELKQDLFANIDRFAPSHTIFLSNTSSLLIEDIFNATTSERQTRVGGLHFFLPVTLSTIVEIIPGARTSSATYESIKQFAAAIRKTQLTCKDTPAFVVNRLLIPFMYTAFQMLDEGIATPEEVDNASRLALGHSVGPFQIADKIGLDLCLDIGNGLFAKGANPLYKSTTLERKVAAGQFGTKTGEGFYKYHNQLAKL